MTQVQRLLGFLRPYTLRFAAAILLMAVVGACEALMALLIRQRYELESSRQELRTLEQELEAT